MNRICPSCSGDFARAPHRDGHPTCPHCGVALYYANGRMKGQTVLLSDKETVDQLIDILCQANQDFGARGSYAERFFSYELLFRSRTYIDRRGNGIGMDYQEFTKELIKFILQQDWWSENLTSVLMVKNHVGRFAKQFYEQERGKQVLAANQIASTSSTLCLPE